MTKGLLTIAIVFHILSSNAQLFSLMPSEHTGINFANHIVESRYLNIFTYEYLFNGGGVAIGDINNDGLSDIFFSGNMMANKLYLNKGNLKFDDISKTANIDKGDGFNTGVCMMDVNGDGWLDIYVCKSALNDAKYRIHNLYINNKDNSFTDKAPEMGLADSSFSTQSYFYDFDNDGDLDMFLLNHPFEMGEAKRIVLTYDKDGNIIRQAPKSYRFSSDRYFVNEGGKFVDRTEKAGLLDNFFGLSAVISDFNNDGYADIYTANDYTGVDALYLNQKNNTFKELSDSFFAHFSYNSMGSDYADLDNDGLEDLMVVDMLPEDNYRQKQFRQQMGYDQYSKLVKYGFKSQFVKNVLHKGVPNKRFAEISHTADMANTDWSWAPLMADFDHNGYKDIYITNGYFHDFTDQDFMKYKMDSIRKMALREDNLEKLKNLMSLVPAVKVNNYFFSNEGGMKFYRNPNNTGLDIPSFSNGAAYGDLDNDGDLEIVVNNVNQPAFVFKNNLMENKGGNFIRLKLTSLQNPNLVYGAKIYFETPDGNKQFYRYYPIRGFMSSHEHFIHTGLAKNTSVAIRIELPQRNVYYTFTNAANETKTINIDELNWQPIIKNNAVLKYNFEDITSQTQLKHFSKENEYIDYKQEPLIPRKYSCEGPAMAVGDINGDKLDDVFIGGAKDLAGKFYLQNVNGKFEAQEFSCFTNDKLYEDVASQFLDFDKDGDLDLIVASGGNDFPNQPKMYPIRLYINQNGNFSRADSNIFPKLYTSAKTIAVGDYNNDGYADVFIGGSIEPGQYGRIPSSYLLKNNAGKFILDDFSKTNEKLYMINDAVWYDLNKDGYQDLIVVGEWTAPMVFKNYSGVLRNESLSIGSFKGWWKSITLADMNGDGNEDLILGNYGTNTRYKGDAATPMTALVSDFDKNGSTDVILSTYNGGKSYPVMIRDNVQDQMPYFRKRFNRYEKYSTATTSDLFTSEELATADTLSANFMQTLIIYNGENSKFSAKILPFECQIFPVNAAIPIDINRDGKKDLLLAGNDYNVEIETGRLDAGQGVVLENLDNKDFIVNHSNNFNMSGDVKSILPIKIKGEDALIIGRNNDYIQIIKLPK